MDSEHNRRRREAIHVVKHGNDAKRFSYRTLLSALVVIALIFPISHLYALDPKKTIDQYVHDKWLKQNGLPGSAVNACLQTSDGYLWFGMTAGLFRFDGETFESVSTITGDNVNREAISSLCESGDGSLWVGTFANQLCRLQNGKIYRYGESEGIKSRNVNALHQSSSKHIWAGTSYGLYRLDGDRFLDVPVAPPYVTGITEDSEGRVWVGTPDGVRILQGDSVTQSMQVTIHGRRQYVTALCADKAGDIWIGGYQGLVRWSDGLMKAFTTADGLSNEQVTVIFEDRDGNIWVGTRKGGLNRYSAGKWTSFTETDGLSNNYVMSIVEDREGSLWVATVDGLNRFKDVNVTPYSTKEGLVSNYISSVAETPDGSLYLLSDETFSITRMKNGKLSEIKTPVGPAFVSHDGRLWVAQTGFLSVVKDGRLKQYDTSAGMPMRWITAIGEDTESILLYINYVGIRRFKDGKLMPYELKKGVPFVPVDYVSCFFLDASGTLWIGTSNGLLRVRDGEVKTFGPADGLADSWVNSILDDGRGSLWIASPRGGVTRFHEGKFTKYNTKVGLFNDEIYCVLEDDAGDLWLSSPRGIGHVSRQELDDFETGRSSGIHTQVFDEADGMKTEECIPSWQPAACRTHDGRLWFATRKGAVVIDPKSLNRNGLIPPTFIKHVIADLQVIAPGDSCSLSPGTEKLEFQYAALSYLVPERVRFKYMLEGFDREFVDAGTRRVAYYTNLPPGKYRFRVMACNNDGVWNETGAAFAFILEPHFYQTYWFYTLVLLLFVGCAIGFYLLRMWQLIKRKRELELKVQEALTSIKVLGGLIPICSSCSKIRNDRGYWDLLEGYIQSHSEAKFSHGLCPDCANNLYPDIFPRKDPA